MDPQSTLPVAIRLTNVKKHFKDRDVEALDGIDLEVAQGEFLSLIGPSGSGKSTLLELMGDIGDEGGPSDGEILIEEKTPQELRQARGYGIVFQDSTLFPWYRVFENCLLPFRIAKTKLRKEGQVKRIESLLEMVGLDRKFWSYYPKELSGGMNQRVLIAQALAGNPRLLVADEPTTALDVTIQAQIIELLGRLRQQLGMAILLITHNLGIVGDVADQVAVMYAGQIVETAPARELLQRPLHPYTRALMNSVPGLDADADRLTAIPGAVPRLGAFPPGCRFAPRCPIAKAECSEKIPELLEVEPGRFVRCPFWKNE